MSSRILINILEFQKRISISKISVVHEVKKNEKNMEKGKEVNIIGKGQTSDHMANQKRSFVVRSQREALAYIIEKWAKEKGIECSAINVIAFLFSEKLLNPYLVDAFISGKPVKFIDFSEQKEFVQVRFYPEGVVEVKTIKKNRGQPQKLIKEV